MAFFQRRPAMGEGVRPTTPKPLPNFNVSNRSVIGNAWVESREDHADSNPASGTPRLAPKHGQLPKK